METVESMEIIDGKTISEEILNEIREELKGNSEKKPCVAFIRVGEDPT